MLSWARLFIYVQCFSIEELTWILAVSDWILAERTRKHFEAENLDLLAIDSFWFAMTCAHFSRDQICTQVDASCSPFGHPTQVNSSWVTSIRCYRNLLANEIQDMYAGLEMGFLRLECTCESVWPPNAISAQVQLAAACEPVWPGLSSLLMLKHISLLLR